MTQRGIPAAGTVVESRVVTTVDTQLAKSYLETSFAEGPRHDQTKVVRALSAKFDQRTMSWELLRDLTHIWCRRQKRSRRSRRILLRPTRSCTLHARI